MFNYRRDNNYLEPLLLIDSWYGGFECFTMNEEFS